MFFLRMKISYRCLHKISSCRSIFSSRVFIFYFSSSTFTCFLNFYMMASFSLTIYWRHFISFYKFLVVVIRPSILWQLDAILSVILCGNIPIIDLLLFWDWPSLTYVRNSPSYCYYFCLIYRLKLKAWLSYLTLSVSLLTVFANFSFYSKSWASI